MVLLFGALVFATSTIFVRENWPAMAFAFLVCLLLALQSKPLPAWILLIPAWGVAQLLAGTTIYPQATAYAVMHWMALAAVFLLASRSFDRRFLDWFVGFAAVQAVLCLAQLHTSQGKILWWVPSGYDDYVYGTFPSYNNFAQFVELALPVALVRAFQNRKQALWYALASGMMFAAVIASTSRAGAILVTLELIGVPLVWYFSRPRQEREPRQVGLILVVIPTFAVMWTLAAGWEQLLKRLQYSDPMSGRKEFLLSALDMARLKPLIGHGLGTFAYGYPNHARIDLPAYVHHAHNDWAEFAADGGIVFALLVLLPLAFASRRMLQEPWALGCAVVAIHAVVDFPFARSGVVAWYFALLGMLHARHSLVFSRWVTSAAAFAGVLAAAWFGAAGVFSLLDTPDALARAVRMVPGDANYWLRHWQLTGEKASLERALALNPLDAQILTEAGLRAEVEGDFARALGLLERSAQVDRNWLPRWSLQQA
jgi:O-antigen ligase